MTGLKPPEAFADIHCDVVELLGRIVAAQEAWAVRAETAGSLDELQPTSEALAYWNLDAEMGPLCLELQSRLDATAERKISAEVLWMPGEMKEVVELAMGGPRSGGPKSGLNDRRRRARCALSRHGVAQASPITADASRTPSVVELRRSSRRVIARDNCLVSLLFEAADQRVHFVGNRAGFDDSNRRTERQSDHRHDEPIELVGAESNRARVGFGVDGRVADP